MPPCRTRPAPPERKAPTTTGLLGARGGGEEQKGPAQRSGVQKKKRHPEVKQKHPGPPHPPGDSRLFPVPLVGPRFRTLGCPGGARPLSGGGGGAEPPGGGGGGRAPPTATFRPGSPAPPPPQPPGAGGPPAPQPPPPAPPHGAPETDRQPGNPGACSSLACGVAGRAAWVGADVVGLFGATTWTHEQTMERHRPCISRTWGAKA